MRPRRVTNGPSVGMINTRICGKCSVIRLFLFSLIAFYLIAVFLSLRSAMLTRAGKGADDDTSDTIDHRRDMSSKEGRTPLFGNKIPHYDHEEIDDDFDRDTQDALRKAREQVIQPGSSELDRDMQRIPHEGSKNSSLSSGGAVVDENHDVIQESIETDEHEAAEGKAPTLDDIKTPDNQKQVDIDIEEAPPEEPTLETLLFDTNDEDAEQAKPKEEPALQSEAKVYLEQTRPKRNVRRLLDSFRTNHDERKNELESQPDYRHPVYMKELEELSAELSTLSEKEVSLRQSLLLMTRLGHRRRVTDLIGGIPLEPLAARMILTSNTSVFDRQGTPDSRNYVEQPIRLQRDVNRESLCAVPCDECRTGGYCDTDKEEITMENVVVKRKNTPYSYVSTSFLKSDVPVPYFSWHDFGMMYPITENKTEFAAAFISNCGYEKRNAIVRYLMTHFSDRPVHSFGKCMNNKAETLKPKTPEGKIEQLQRYMFSLAFENSETNDYVTEKFFGTLASGSVPVYMGAPNIKFFAPDSEDYPYESDAVIRVGDFSDSAEQLAKVLRALDSNRDAYEDMLHWKKTGYTDDFKAMLDMTDVHSSCRACIFIADERRRIVGPNKFDVSTIKRDTTVSPANYFLYVRERGSYSFVEMAFSQPPSSLALLIRKILERVKRREVNIWKHNDDLRPWRHVTRVYAIYTINGRRPVLSNQDIKALPEKAELEVIFV